MLFGLCILVNLMQTASCTSTSNKLKEARPLPLHETLWCIWTTHEKKSFGILLFYNTVQLPRVWIGILHSSLYKYTTVWYAYVCGVSWSILIRTRREHNTLKCILVGRYPCRAKLNWKLLSGQRAIAAVAWLEGTLYCDLACSTIITALEHTERIERCASSKLYINDEPKRCITYACSTGFHLTLSSAIIASSRTNRT